MRYDKTMEDGMEKKVTELYVVDALSFSEAEKRITDEMATHASGEFAIADLKIAPYKEIFFADNDEADKWYKAKLAFVTIDEKTSKEKKTSVLYLVNAGSVGGCVKSVDEVMSTTMIDYQIMSVQETAIMDVIEYQ